MSNNVPITDGSGTSSIAAEQIGSTKYQIIKVVGGETGSTSVLGVNPDRSINVSIIGIGTVAVAGGSVGLLGGTAFIGNVGVASGSILALPTGNQSVSGTIGASIIGTVPVTQSGAWSTSMIGTVGASIVGIVPVQLSNSSVITVIQSSIAAVIVGGSIAASFTPPANQSVSGAISVSNFPTTQNVSGSVVGFQGGVPWATVNVGSIITTNIGSVVTILQSPSIVGTYAEDAASAGGDKGVFVLGVRNDTVASLVSADLDYAAMASDSAGRGLIKPFASEEARVEGYASLVSSSVTTLVAAAGAGLRNYITDIMIANSGATTTVITFKDGAGSILGYTIAPTGGGSNLIGMMMPMRTGVNATFDFQPTASSSILFATVKGYKAP